MPPTRRSARAASGPSPYQTTRANTTRTASLSSSASIARQSGQGLRLTVKTNPSKLRQATSGPAVNGSIPPNPYADGSESDATPQPANKRSARSTRNPRTVVEKDTSEDEDEEVEDEIMVDQGVAAEEEEEDEEEEEEEEEVEEDDEEEDEEEEEEEEQEQEDEAGVDEELLANEDSEADENDSEDELQVGHRPSQHPSAMKRQVQAGTTKPNVMITAPPEEAIKSVEVKEMEEEEEDEELSELESGDEREIGGEGDEDDDDDDSDSDSDNSRSGTPDLSKLTRRQRGYFEEDASLMALSNEAQKKKHLSAEEHAMRRAEMARRRKNLSEKRNEEEKQDTINKLLKKPAPKRRTRAEIIAQQQADAMSGTPGYEEGEEERADPLFTRWINGREGSRLGVPDEWLSAPVGEMFASSNPSRVQEVV